MQREGKNVDPGDFKRCVYKRIFAPFSLRMEHWHKPLLKFRSEIHITNPSIQVKAGEFARRDIAPKFSPRQRARHRPG